jgi:hypothetical protein
MKKRTWTVAVNRGNSSNTVTYVHTQERDKSRPGDSNVYRTSNFQFSLIGRNHIYGDHFCGASIIHSPIHDGVSLKTGVGPQPLGDVTPDWRVEMT